MAWVSLSLSLALVSLSLSLSSCLCVCIVFLISCYISCDPISAACYTASHLGYECHDWNNRNTSEISVSNSRFANVLHYPLFVFVLALCVCMCVALHQLRFGVAVARSSEQLFRYNINISRASCSQELSIFVRCVCLCVCHFGTEAPQDEKLENPRWCFYHRGTIIEGRDDIVRTSSTTFISSHRTGIAIRGSWYKTNALSHNTTMNKIHGDIYIYMHYAHTIYTVTDKNGIRIALKGMGTLLYWWFEPMPSRPKLRMEDWQIGGVR